MSSKPLRKRRKPRIRIFTKLENIEIDLAERQLNHLSVMFKNIYIFGNKISCSHLVRPQAKDYKKWWTYIGECVLHLTKKPNLRDFKRWARDVNAYSRIYEFILSARVAKYSRNSGSNENATNVAPITTVAIMTNDAAKSGNVYNLPEEFFLEKQRIESEWNFKRLLAIRRVIFEKFVNTPLYKSYLMTIKNPAESASAASTGIYGYFSWSLNSIKDYYYGSMPKSNAPELNGSNSAG